MAEDGQNSSPRILITIRKPEVGRLLPEVGRLVTHSTSNQDMQKLEWVQCVAPASDLGKVRRILRLLALHHPGVQKQAEAPRASFDDDRAQQPTQSVQISFNQFMESAGCLPDPSGVARAFRSASSTSLASEEKLLFINGHDLDYHKKKLGVGGEAWVFKALWRTKGVNVAVKAILSGLEGFQSVLHEAAMLHLMREKDPAGNFLVKCYGVTIYEQDGELFPALVLECADYDLDKILKTQSNGWRKNFKARIQLCSQIAQALVFLHAQGVVHRDIKPANVLFSHAKGHPLLSDFGLARATRGGKSNMSNVGTEWFIAPELQLRKSTVGNAKAVDVFAFGRLMSCLLVLSMPDKESVSRNNKIYLKDKSLPSELCSMVISCQNKHASRRPTMVEVLAVIQKVLDTTPAVGQIPILKLDGKLAVKILIVGASNVGKYSLLQVYWMGKMSKQATNFSMQDLDSELELKKSVIPMIADTQANGKARIRIFDTFSLNVFQDSLGLYNRGMHAYVVVIDLTLSLDEARQQIKAKQDGVDGSTMGFLFGNKSDLKEVQINTEAGRALAVEFGLFNYFELSAVKDPAGVRNAFENVSTFVAASKKDET
eukprot:gb/GEZN01002338.1/.p1 GENE.gb/GEZN01002338.1/~~gb/GEZN01002338.1/.p1  ORF type:complete len:600 (+),score=76.68 gb/GEZN01002338.1/:431-2230(+)